MEKPVIGYIGNFKPKHSTENDRKWSFEKLGYKVIPYQENNITALQLEKMLKRHAFDILLYSHTHDWNITGLVKFFLECRVLGVPTASVHLDRWAWLDREKDMGHEATWFTEYQFMADGSPEAVELYNSLGLQWYFLKPAVVERDCYMDTESFKEAGGYLYDVVFVGSREYHKEYPFRPQLVDFLKETYGDRFGFYGGDGETVVRGNKLNRLFAVSKVVVGDSCFGNRPRYWSDRVPETIGRGGFLLHPHNEGQTIPHATYKANDLSDLKKQIDYWVSHDTEREMLRYICFEHVKEFDTYTNRAQEILSVLWQK